MFKIIACVGKNLELGRKNDLVFHIPEDMKYFRETTTGKPVIMGGNTFRSLPGALKGRRNVVLSRSDDFPAEVEVFHSLEDILAKFKDEDEAFVIATHPELQNMPYDRRYEIISKEVQKLISRRVKAGEDQLYAHIKGRSVKK
jgi:hypothetical protein